jgi:two-component system, NarL family, sensor kinase
MKKLIISIILHVLAIYAVAENSADSLKTVLHATKPNRENLELYLQYLHADVSRGDYTSTLIFQWLEKNSFADSLLDIRASANLAMGRYYTVKHEFAEATRFLMVAQSIAEKENFPDILSMSLNTLGVIYQDNEQYDRAISYFEQAIAIGNKYQYPVTLSKAFFNLGKLTFDVSNGNYIKQRHGLNLMLAAFRITSQLKDTQSIMMHCNAIASVYSRLRKYDSTIYFLSIAEGMLKNNKTDFSVMRFYSAKAAAHLKKKEHDKALELYNAGLEIAKKGLAPRWMCQFYYGLADTYEEMGDFKMANKFNRLNMNLHDELVSRENFVAAADIQNKYERAKKDNEILKLAAVNKQKSSWNKILIVSLFALFIISGLGYMNYRKSRQLAKQKTALQYEQIVKLEKERQLLSIDAMLKGQEEERSRIAKELHDGLGALLSGVKLSVMNLKDNLQVSDDKLHNFEKPLLMLDRTITDLRKVAHNLMPEILVKFGLDEAVKDFCNAIETSTGISVVYQNFGEKRKLDNTSEMFTYRIIQELVNNAVKHGNPSEIIVQLIINSKKTILTVEDNGKGFQKELLNGTKGAGMININYRVNYFNGTMDIVTAPGEGTSVHIELMA